MWLRKRCQRSIRFAIDNFNTCLYVLLNELANFQAVTWPRTPTNFSKSSKSLAALEYVSCDLSKFSSSWRMDAPFLDQPLSKRTVSTKCNGYLRLLCFFQCILHAIDLLLKLFRGFRRLNTLVVAVDQCLMRPGLVVFSWLIKWLPKRGYIPRTRSPRLLRPCGFAPLIHSLL